jgi:phosphatidate cytidylyltransferase
MSGRDDSGGKGYNRPWEEGDDEGAPVFSLFDQPDDEPAQPPPSDDEEGSDDGAADAEEHSDIDEMDDWEAMASDRSDLQAYTSEEYLSATTQEYQGLADEVNRANEEKWEQQAVSAPVAGVGSGLVGFEDVSGTASGSEEDYEALEQAASSDLALRIGSGLAIFGLFLGSLVLGGWWFTTFVILVMLIAVGELYGTVRTVGYKPLALFGLLGTVLVGVGTHAMGVYAIGAWVVMVTLVTILFVSLTPRRSPLEDTAITVLGLAWVSMLAFAIPFGFAATPVAWVFFAVVLVAFNDVGAYFVGRAFGKHPLAPMLSPKKTVEGFVGGLILAAMAASVLVTFPYWEPIGLARGLVLAGIVGFTAPLGDLVESMVKRSIGVKDMGSVLPGHGGMLDRIDGFLFALPALYLAFSAYGLL